MLVMLLLLALALVWALIINSWRIRRKAGRSLLDLGRTGRLVGYAGAMFSLLLAAVGVLMARLQAEPRWLLYTGFFVSLAVMGFLDARTSRELRQNGVLLRSSSSPGSGSSPMLGKESASSPSKPKSAGASRPGSGCGSARR